MHEFSHTGTKRKMGCSLMRGQPGVSRPVEVWITRMTGVRVCTELSLALVELRWLVYLSAATSIKWPKCK